MSDFKNPALLLLSILIPVLLAGTVTVQAQNETKTDTTGKEAQMVDEILENMEQEQNQTASMPDSLMVPPSAFPPQMVDDSIKSIYRDAMYAYYEYRVSGFQHRKEVFDWQLFSSKLIFWSVLLLVFSGITFSGIQFYKSMSRVSVVGGEPPESSVTEFEASAKGIKVTSPVLGVIILVISLAFFYLYLIYVYPIKEIF